VFVIVYLISPELLQSAEERYESQMEQQAFDSDSLVENLQLELNQLRTMTDSDSDRHVAEVLVRCCCFEDFFSCCCFRLLSLRPWLKIEITNSSY
jgi:hypothetical protein